MLENLDGFQKIIIFNVLVVLSLIVLLLLYELETWVFRFFLQRSASGVQSRKVVFWRCKMKFQGADVVSRWNAQGIELKQEAQRWKTQKLNTVSTR